MLSSPKPEGAFARSKGFFKKKLFGTNSESRNCGAIQRCEGCGLSQCLTCAYITNLPINLVSAWSSLREH